MRKVRPHLLVAIHDRSLGRTEMAVRLAMELRAIGEPVHLLVHDRSAFLLERSGLPFDIVADHLQGLTRVLIDTLVRRLKPVTIIYFDFFNTANYLAFRGAADPRFLLGYGCPIMSLDTWHYDVTGAVVDLQGGRHRSLALVDSDATVSAFESISRRLIPVPMAHPDPGAGKFSCLPKRSERRARPSWKRAAGLSEADKVVLFCTAKWQHARMLESGYSSTANLLPRCLAEYVRRLGPRVHLVHVGPESYDLPDLADRYHWIQPLDRMVFEALMQATDLLVAANVSATSIGWAVQYRVPVLLLKNSRAIADADTLRAVCDGLPEALQDDLRRALPLDPFLLWPLGYHQFLDPLMRDNPLCDTLVAAEFLDADGAIEACRSLLDDTPTRRRVAVGQREYARKVNSLPSGGEAVRRLM